MLTRCLATILPAMTLEEALEITRIHRVASLTSGRTAVVIMCPFRAPHHTISDVGLIGGGHIPLPSEVSLVHRGMLFLDERPSASATSSKSYASRWKIVSYNNHLAHISDFLALAALAERVKAATAR